MQKLLILGWGDAVLMIDLLSELDHGPSALPKHSEVTMFNTRTAQEVLGMSSMQQAIIDAHIMCHSATLYKCNSAYKFTLCVWVLVDQ